MGAANWLRMTPHEKNLWWKALQTLPPAEDAWTAPRKPRTRRWRRIIVSSCGLVPTMERFPRNRVPRMRGGSWNTNLRKLMRF